MGVPVQTRTTGDVEQPEPTLRQKALGGASAAVDAALSGYSAASSQELSTGEQLFGLGSAVASGAAVGGPIGAVVAGLAYVFGVGKGNSKRRREEKRAANIEVLTREVGAVALPYLYGYCKVKPLPIYFGAGNTIGQSSTAYRGGLGGLFTTSLGDPSTKTIAGGDEAFALQQFDLAAGAVSRVVDVLFRGRSIRDAAADNFFRLRSFMRMYPAGTAGDFAALFVPVGDPASVRRGARTTFLGKSHLDALFWQWYGDPGNGFFDDQVELDSAFLFGDKVAPPTRTGTGASAAHGVGAAVESRNTFAVAFDYLTAPAKGPRNVPRSAVHLPSLYECWERGEVLLGGGAAGTAGVALDAAALGAQCREVVVANGAVDQSSTARTLRDCVQALGRGTGGNANTGISANSRVLLREGGAYRKRRYTFDGEVPSDAPPSAGLSLILETAPGAIAFPDHDGLLRFDVPDPSVLPGDADYAQGEINDDHLLAHPVVRHPASTESANSIVVTHPDVNADFAENQQVVPAPGSALADQLRALDGEEIPTAITLEGVIDPELARSAGLNYLLQRRRPRGTCVTTLSPFRFLEGCRVRLRSDAAKLDMVVRILGKQIVDATIVWSFIEYRAVDYGYHPAAIDPFDGLAPSADSVPPPTGVSAAYDASIGRVRVSWTPADPLRAAEYHLAKAVTASGGTPGDSDWTGLTVVDGDETAFADPVEPGEHSHHYRIRSGGRRGGFSAWVNAPAVTATAPEAVIYGPLPSGSECPPSNRGIEGSLWITPDGRVWRRTGGVWVRAIPADVGPDGVHGILWRASGLPASSSGDPVIRYSVTAGAGAPALSDNLTVRDGTTFGRLEARTASAVYVNTFLRLNPGVVDFNAELETDIGFALRDSDGNTIHYDKTSADPQEPYEWFSDSERIVNTAAVRAFIARTGAAPFDMVLYRPSLVCAADPINPWVEDAEFEGGEDGRDGDVLAEGHMYRSVNVGAAAPAAPNHVRFGYVNGVFSGASAQDANDRRITEWVGTHPGASATQDVYCATFTMRAPEGKNTSGASARPVHVAVCDYATDVNLIYQRSAATPAKPTANARVPPGWSDDPPSGNDQVWACFGSIQAGTWKWKQPYKDGQGEPGDDGDVLAEGHMYRAVNVGSAAPAAPNHVRFGYVNGVFSGPSAQDSNDRRIPEWVETHPGVSATQDVYCATFTMRAPEGKNTSGASARPVHVAVCDYATDVNLIYQRASSTPDKPTANSRVPSGWSDNPPTNSTDQLWACFGSIQAGTWKWKEPYKDGQGPAGEDGTTAVVVVQPPTVTTLGLSGNKATRTITITAHTGAANYTISWLIVLPNGTRDSGSANVASAGAHVFGTSPLPALTTGSTVLIAVYANGAAGTLASATLEWTL